jgi:hypothetical protein
MTTKEIIMPNNRQQTRNNFAFDRDNIENILRHIEHGIEMIGPMIGQQNTEQLRQMLNDLNNMRREAERLLDRLSPLLNSGGVSEAVRIAYDNLLSEFSAATDNFLRRNNFPMDDMHIDGPDTPLTQRLAQIWQAFVSVVTWMCQMTSQLLNQQQQSMSADSHLPAMVLSQGVPEQETVGPRPARQ